MRSLITILNALAKNTSSKIIFRISRDWRLFSLSAVMALSACVPKEVSLPTSLSSLSGSGSYAGFTGITSAQTMSATKVQVSWTASSDSRVIAYNIYDATLPFSPKLLKTVSAPITSTTITNLYAATYYKFRVRAADANNVEDSNTIDVAAIPYGGISDAVVQGSTSALIKFNDASNADAVSIYCKSGSDTTYTRMVAITNVSLTQTTISNLSTGVSYTCKAALTINTYEDNNTTTVTFTPMGTASKLVFSTQPGSALAGAPLTPQPVVKIQDANGNTVTSGPDSTAVVTLSVSTRSPTGGNVSGTYSVAAVNGVATFSNVNVQTTGLKILTASKGSTLALPFGSDVITQDSSSLTISPGAVSATNSSISLAPNGPLIANGSASYTVTMVLKDSYGNAVPGITPNFGSTNNNDLLSQPTHVTDSTGSASGSISSTVVGGTNNNGLRTLSITSPSGLTSVSTSATFIPGPASQLAFTAQPQNSPAGAGGMTSNIVVAIQDANGNLVSSTDSAANTNIQVALSSAPAGGVLSGTTTVAAVNGIATFSGLGIDKSGTNYKMKAVAPAFPTLTQPNSYPFNITAAPPVKIAFSSGPSTLVSSTTGSSASVCGTYVVQLQDGGNNPANATTTTTVTLLSTYGSALFYNSANCSGTPTSQITIGTGKNSATISMRDPKAETTTLSAGAAGLTTGNLSVAISPAQFVLSGGPVSVKSGVCSAGITLTTQGADGTSGNVLSSTSFTFTYLNSGSASNAMAYSDSFCTQALGASPATISIAANSSSATIYFKDNSAEGPIAVALATQNGMNNATTNPALETVTIYGSQLTVSDPALPVVAGGSCVGPYVVQALDANNSLANNTNNVLNFVGGSSHTTFYSSSTCSSPLTNLTLASGTASFWIGDSVVESLSISLSDSTAAPLKMTSSNSVSISTWPYQLSITSPTTTQSLQTGPLPNSTANSTVCLPITIASQYISGTSIAPLSAITIDLQGAGTFSSTGATYYSDSACTTSISSVSLSSASTTIYFMSLQPGSFVLNAVDHAGVLQPTSTLTANVTSQPAWIGTRQKSLTSTDNYTWTVASNFKPSIGILDGFQGARNIHFDSTHTYLFIPDHVLGKVIKYNYSTGKYLGWIGGYANNGMPVVGGAAGCQSLNASGQQTPGWCFGGASNTNGQSTYGNFYTPYAITDDGYNLYVSNTSANTVMMFNMATGAFEGWIGYLYATATTSPPTGAATTVQSGTSSSSLNPNGATISNTCGSTAAGNPTPGFCNGGTNATVNTTNAVLLMDLKGNGLMYNPRAILWANNYLYVAMHGEVARYKATPGSNNHGQFDGWIGKIGATAPTSCTSGSPSTNIQTPGWCTGGVPTPVTPSATGGLNNPTGLYADTTNDWLYITDTNTITRYRLSTGVFDSLRSTYNTSGTTLGDLTSDGGSNLLIADGSRVFKTDASATGLTGWIGKVNVSPTTPSNCNGLAIYSNTPGWCNDGTPIAGIDEGAFALNIGIAYDGNGHFITSQYNFPSLQKWNASTGAYEGQLALASASPSNWATSTEFAAGGGFDDNSLWSPKGSVVVGTTLYVVDQLNSRIKKISTITGQTLGWIGGITSVPTGGDSACTAYGVSPMVFSPGWCLGSYTNPNYLWGQALTLISQNTPGVMYNPSAITSDGTYLYVTDISFNRIHRYTLATGAYSGWIGWINTTLPSSCTGGTPSTASFTPGWCTGGNSTSSAADGGMNQPSSIAYAGGNLYVVDLLNYRVNSYNASTGAFNGWIGRMNVNNASCVTQSNGGYTYTHGWCKGSAGVYSTSQMSVYADPGGGFTFNDAATRYTVSGIAVDNTYLYIGHTQNNRIDRFWLNSGTGHSAGDYKDSVNVMYNSTPATGANWTATPGAWGDWGYNSPTGIYPAAVYIDSTNGYLYHTVGNAAVVKRTLSTGATVGWMGGVGSTPTSCTPSGNMTVKTPGWCIGGSFSAGTTFGSFGSGGALYISGDANYIYVSDATNNRIMRLPK